MSRSIAAAYGIAGLSAAIAAIAVFAPLPDRAEPAPTEPIAVEAAPAELDILGAPTTATPFTPDSVASQGLTPRAQRLAARTALRVRGVTAAVPTQEELIYVDERGRPIDPLMASAPPRGEHEDDENEEHEAREHGRRGGSRERDDD